MTKLHGDPAIVAVFFVFGWVLRSKAIHETAGLIVPEEVAVYNS